jgi:glutamine amidotransferase
MCFLGVCIADRFKPGELARACESNPDGFGFAYLAHDVIEYVNTFDSDEAIREFDKFCKRYPNGIGVFHARYATHGAVNVDNCHPFQVDSKTVLAHNGILPLTPAEGDKRSDTALLAEQVMPEWMPWLDSPEISDLERWMAGNKVAILTTHKRLRDSIYILNESLGHWRDGCWYSNHSYAPRTTVATYGNWFKSAIGSTLEKVEAQKFEIVEMTCDLCRGAMSYDDDHCPHCLHCVDCGRLNCKCGSEFDGIDMWGELNRAHRLTAKKVG